MIKPAPIFKVCSQSEDVKAFLGDSPVRFYLFGFAPQSPTYPYAVWQVVNGAPENYINETPNIDGYTLQVDVYAKSASDARGVTSALIDAIEPHAYVTSYRPESRDDNTMNYRNGFDVDWLVNR
ncbi:DUF3168 domain-containing protein [Vibrio porteresiae]|uniref:DUF3168 domain-containing protein n=1 Tax=Vibrio porteresiae DSM 19223 TaxID=1123496 RepID=A0ABZ0QAX2_9VIBR|nr:DUF3168 domain-containing protein [Vibrio porteresiae]WPC72922.1 DUF3168 domain-containing protein [Vibrio porteresiae DSM 19223]